MKCFYVYILASKKNGTIYIGSTSNLEQRIYQHKNKLIDGFTKKYSVDRLVYFEQCDNAEQSTNRERQLKEWRRTWRLDLIEKNNPEWEDLAEEYFDWIPNQVRDDARDNNLIVGIDEVGRGCWAGPLVAAAVCMNKDVAINELTDSKKLSAKKRRILLSEIQKSAHCIGIGWVWPKEINKIGLTESVRLAMQRAINEVKLSGQQIIIDGSINYLPQISNTEAVIKADESIQAVSAASVVAKVARDTYMEKISKKYPEYGFEKHVGYGTQIHLDALKQYGVLSLHRINYRPIQKLLADSL